jgi:hypothetical protein
MNSSVGIFWDLFKPPATRVCRPALSRLPVEPAEEGEGSLIQFWPAL